MTFFDLIKQIVIYSLQKLNFYFSNFFFFNKKKKHDFIIQGEYIISTNRGIYSLNKDFLEKKNGLNTFGISVDSNDIYLSVFDLDKSLILVKRNFKIKKKLNNFKLLYSFPTDHSGRFHQICTLGSNLWIANTFKNSLTIINKKNGNFIGNIAPFFCQDNHPIMSDHNHINGVSAYKDSIVFTAFRINKKSAIGLIGNGKIKIFSYPNMGIHDVIILKNQLLISDSYRMWEKSCGGIKINSKFINESFFEDNNYNFVRGLSIFRDEMIVGNSFQGERKNRFKGKGSILVRKKEKFLGALNNLPPQIYTIRNIKSQDEKREISYKDINKLLIDNCGNPHVVRNILDCQVGETAKKFDNSDLFNVEGIFQ